MKRNSKVLSVIAAAVIALLAAGCVTVPSADLHPRPSRNLQGCVRSERNRSAAPGATTFSMPY